MLLGAYLFLGEIMAENKVFMVASDIHGSLLALDLTLQIFNEIGADKLILLGDIFGTNSDEMVEKLNQISNRLVVVKGNNDWYFESLEAKFDIFEQTYVNLNGKICYVCHGHRLNDMALASYGASVILQGHLHRPYIEKRDGVVRVCPGSIASPRFGSEKSYAVVTENRIQIKSVYGEIIDEVTF